MILAIMDCSSSRCEKSVRHSKPCRDHSRCVQVRQFRARHGTIVPDRASLLRVATPTTDSSVVPFHRHTGSKSKKTLTRSMTTVSPAELQLLGRSPLDNLKITVYNCARTPPLPFVIAIPVWSCFILSFKASSVVTVIERALPCAVSAPPLHCPYTCCHLYPSHQSTCFPCSCFVS